VKDRLKTWLPYAFALLFALSRIPDVMPPNFSAVYGFVLCAGAFVVGRTGWVLPLVTLILTDIGLNFYYQIRFGYNAWTGTALLSQLGNYAGYLLLFGMGKLLRRNARLWNLVGASLFGAVFFYLVTNTLAWFLNPFGNREYTRDLAGWILALTRGIGGWEETWTFFLRTLSSSALFTALFAGAWLYAGSESPADKGEQEPQAAPQADAEPEEVKA
jgi:hypothetical protein